MEKETGTDHGREKKRETEKKREPPSMVSFHIKAYFFLSFPELSGVSFE